MKLLLVTVRYDSFEGDTLAVCTTLKKAQRICVDKESEAGDMPLEWQDKGGVWTAWGTYQYIITPIEKNKRFL